MRTVDLVIACIAVAWGATVVVVTALNQNDPPSGARGAFSAGHAMGLAFAATLLTVRAPGARRRSRSR